MILVICLD